jgi:spore germination cell wall hydrolase CwlJ-like protein
LTRNERVIALTILGEARGEGEIGMFAVACVIQRRSWEREKTSAEICLQPWQFSIWNAGKGKVKRERDLWHLWDSKHMMYARHLARCLNNERIVLFDITKGANHYYSKKYLKTPPDHLKGSKPTITIKNHVFYKLD